MLELALIKRPKNLVYCEVDVEFNSDYFLALEIDLDHVNFGKKKARTSNITALEVIEITTSLIMNKFLIPDDSKSFKDANCEYFSVIGKWQKKKYKLVFCVCSDRPGQYVI